MTPTMSKRTKATNGTVAPMMCCDQSHATDPSSCLQLAQLASLTPRPSNIHHHLAPSSVICLQFPKLRLPGVRPTSPFNTHRTIAAAPQVRAG
jgi:hypothetical protein